MFFELILTAFVALVFWDYLSKKRRNDMLAKYNIPRLKSLPLIGSALELSNLSTENMLIMSKEYTAKYGKIYYFWILNQLVILITDIKYLEPILSSQQLTKKSIIYDFLETWLGRGLLLSTGKKWHARRKIITPTFHFKILEQFAEVFDQQSTIMVKKLYEKADGKTPINIAPIVCLTALDIIAETAMGVKVNAQENPDFEYVQALSYVARVMADRFIKPWHRIDWLFRLTAYSTYKKMTHCIDVMHNFTTQVIEQRRAALQKSIADNSQTPLNNETNDIGIKKRMALLDVLLQSTVDGNPLSNDDIREEVDTFMFAGHDTTTSGTSFCLYLISRHPDVQEKLIEEIHQVLGYDKNRAITYRDLQELKYLECTVKEALRLYPSVPGIGRKTTEDVVLGDITIPAGANLNISFYLPLRDPDYFLDPEAFKPERFTSDSTEKIHPFAYTPFSAGPRNCIGQKFAMLEMKSAVSKVLRHFKLLPLGPDIRPMINLVLRSATGVHIGLQPRT